MRITKRKLRSLIREAIAGHVHGDPEKEAFLDIAMAAIRKTDYVRAADAIMNSFMIDDTYPEDEQALVDMLSATPAGVSSGEVEALADQWIQGYRAGTYREI
tara:strand:- start:39 stop:344 length:306 start_codon:yes stop_codon:yes gene_type:complete